MNGFLSRRHVAFLAGVIPGYRTRLCLVLALLTVCGAQKLRADEPDGAAVYLKEVKPVLIHHCSACHGGLKQSGGLRLDTAAAIRKGGDSGPAIEPGDADASLIIQVLRGEAGFEMPPEGEGTPPSQQELQRIARWIDSGAVGPENEPAQVDPREHWSYQPPRRPELPSAGQSAWVRNPIDVLVAAQHERLGLTPQPEAQPAVLMRRLYLDLIGIPPTPDELQAFTSDPSDAAYERMVDDLLSRPQYGERWGRHWMDVWRYSDWYGRRPSNEIRYSQRHIWRWRDWIIQSLNQDKGYDRMLAEMLAGDEIAPLDNDVLAATGYLGRNWYKFDRNTWLYETVEQTGRGFMAVTLRCCRCHDHKYDPISQREYYEFRAFFEPHSVRTDAVAGVFQTEVDNGKDKVLADGLSRAFDKELNAATYVFRRGDDRQPDREHPLQPSVPSVLGQIDRIETVTVPPLSHTPQLSAARVSVKRAAFAARMDEHRKKIDEVDKQRTQLARQLAESDAEPAAQGADEIAFLRDEFDSLDPEKWEIKSGQWKCEDGRLVQSQVTTFATLVSRQKHPRNFVVKLRYRKLQPGTYRSVGVSFDYQNGGRDSQDVYTARSDARPHGSVQAFHRKAGRQVYPPAGIRSAEIEVGQWMDLEFQVRDSRLVIRLNGEVKLEYDLPIERKPGQLALWVHMGSAEFERLEVTPLPVSPQDLQNEIAAADYQIEHNRQQLELVRLEAEAEEAIVDAERVRLGVVEGDYEVLAHAAAVAKLRAQLQARQVELLVAERAVALNDSDESRRKAMQQQAARDAAQLALDAAIAGQSPQESAYKQFENEFPKTSSGRRLALARWLVNPQHPRTSRVAVNHIWLRHFGRAIVPTVDNFGASGQDPSHPQLLDWLAVELIEQGWRMKPLHKLIVMSATYRLSSRSGSANSRNHEIDPENLYLWRAHSRRMEAEVVRDSLLAVTGKMDARLGGPDLDEKTGQNSRRRSLYFRTTPDNQMPMLALFDQASPTECYRRRESVIPQQALALSNGRLTLDLARTLAGQLTAELEDAGNDTEFAELAFQRILSRTPTDTEVTDCLEYLKSATKLLEDPADQPRFPASPQQATVPPSESAHQRARENLVHVLFNHNDFVTIR